MKDGWKYSTIDECCNVNYGTRVVRRNVHGDKYPVYGGGGETFRMDEYNREDCLVVSRFAMSPQCTRIVNGKFFLNDSGLTVTPKDGSGLTPLLLDRYLLASNDTIYSFGRGSAQRNLSMDEFRKMPVSYPISLSEQQEIVTYLDTAFEKIERLKENAEKSLSDAKTLFQSALKEMMQPKDGWEEKTLKEVSLIAGNYGLSVSSVPFNGVRYLRITDITEMGKLNDDKVSADMSAGKNQEELVEGDILFARTGATVGKTLVYKKEYGHCLFAGYLIRYRLDKTKVLPQFAFYITHSTKYYDWVRENQKAAAQPNIGAQVYNTYLLQFPSLEDQHSIVTTLDALSEKVSALEANYTKTIAECAALKQALLREVFE